MSSAAAAAATSASASGDRPSSRHTPTTVTTNRPEVQKYRPRACQSCARSKMRCVWPSEPGATPCLRCSKIKAPCTLPEINPRRRRGPSTRVGQLEEKIDGIMSLLNASQQIQQNSPSPSPRAQSPPREHGRNSIHQLLNPNVESSNSSTSLGSNAIKATEGVPQGTQRNLHTTARLVAPPPSSHSQTHPNSPAPNHHYADTTTIEIVTGFHVTLFEADRALNIYRSLHMPYFPFVTLPAMARAHDLYTQTPLLLRTVVAVTTPPPSSAIQAAWRTWFRSWVAEHVVVKNEKRLEILQAILIYLAWGDFYFLTESQATNLIQLALALVMDLGLNRWPIDYGKATFLMFREVAINSGDRAAILPGSASWKKKHSLDEMRAALGTFYVTSLCAALFRRHQPMTYTSYLAKCCKEVDEAQEYDSDKFLVTLVKLQQLLNKGADLIPYSDDEAERRIPYPPSHMALTSVQREMEVLIREQPPSVECNALLWVHYHGTVCRLFEPVIYIRSPSHGPAPSHTPTARTTALWTALHAARDCMTAYLAISPSELPCIPFHTAHLTFCIITAARLLLLDDDPDWTSALARQAIDFDGLCARIVDLFVEADRLGATAAGGRGVRYLHEPDRSVLVMLGDKLRWLRAWFAGRARAKDAAGPGGAGGIRAEARGSSNSSGVSGQQQQQQQQQVMDMDLDMVAPPADLDEGFWQALFEWGGNGSAYWMEVQS